MKKLIAKWRIIRIKTGHWEYWNSSFLLLPVLPYLAYLWLKARHMFFFNAANPGIEYGGMVMESKWKIHTSATPGFFPHTLQIDPGEDLGRRRAVIESSLQFPFIAKPDIGSKGRGVVLIRNWSQLEQYHHHCPIPYLLQEKISYPCEAGIFYVRMPGEATGRITGIVEKEFISVKGDGKKSLEELLNENSRYLLQLESLRKLLGEEAMKEIVPAGRICTPVDIGNHARGSLFLNRSSRATPALTRMMDGLCRNVPGFYIGRLDIRFESWEALEAGKDFAVIEVNGAGSDPTHIYDPSNSLFFVWKEVCRHWRMIYEVSRANHRRGVPYMRWREGVNLFRENARLDKQLAAFDPHPVQKEGAVVRVLAV